MASKNVNEVVGRAVLDASFRTALLKDPKAACEGAGLPLDAAEYAALANIDAKKFERAARDLTGMGGTAG